MHPLHGRAGVGLSAQQKRHVNDDTCKMLNKIQNVQVSDATVGDNSNAAHCIIINIILKT
jgi:hypothetical protein